MGQPTAFAGSNTIMHAPPGAENVQDMHVFRPPHLCVSCWTVTAEELAEITRTGRIFLSVLMSGQQPPVYVGSESACREVSLDFGPVWPAQPPEKKAINPGNPVVVTGLDFGVEVPPATPEMIWLNGTPYARVAANASGDTAE